MPRRKHPPHRALQRTKPCPRHRSQSLGQRLRRNPRPAALPSGGQGAQASATASLFRCRKTTYRPDSTIHTLKLQTVINNKYVRYIWREHIRNQEDDTRFYTVRVRTAISLLYPAGGLSLTCPNIARYARAKTTRNIPRNGEGAKSARPCPNGAGTKRTSCSGCVARSSRRFRHCCLRVFPTPGIAIPTRASAAPSKTIAKLDGCDESGRGKKRAFSLDGARRWWYLYAPFWWRFVRSCRI